MDDVATTGVAVAARRSYVDWNAIFAGAVAAAALSFLLMTFGSALGLSATSPWKGLSATGMMIWAAVWTVLVQIGCFAAGGYLAGRMRTKVSDTHTEETEFRDGAHGFLVWAIGALIGALMLASAATSAIKAGGQAAGAAASALGAGASQMAGQMMPVNPVDTAVDALLRPAPAGNLPPQQQSAEDRRAEISRILTQSLARGEISEPDKQYLARLISARTGITPDEAAKRIDTAVTGAQRTTTEVKEQAKAAAETARKTTLLAGFIAAAAMLVSLAAAATAAVVGGKHRDEGRSLALFGTTRLW